MRASKSLIAVFLLITAVCIRLGLWQLDRLHDRRAANTVTAARRAEPIVTVAPGFSVTDTSLAQRRVRVSGRYDDTHAITLRNYVLDGVPGVQLVVPLMLEGGDTAVLVNRGFIPAPDGMTAAQRPSSAPNPVRVEGIALPIENAEGKPVTRPSGTTWGRLELAALRDSLPYPILAIYLRQAPDSASARHFPRPLPLSPLDDGPHLSYALQWFAFAALGLIFSGIVWRKRR